MRVLFWMGWILLIWAWGDFALGWLWQFDIWKETFGLVDPSPVHFSPMLVSCFAVVFIAVGRAK